MKPLCVSVVADRGYQEYLPLYLFFLFHAYPHYEAIVYFDGPMYPEVVECLRLVRGVGAFEIKPVPYRHDPEDVWSVRSMRWVLYDDDFAGYENVYTGDVDLLIVRETPELREMHVRHSEEIELPYSNRVRRGFKRLTGLHFVRTHAYYPRVLPVMATYREKIAAGRSDVFDEELLYRMMEETVGLPRKHGDFALHHGIHLGVFRRGGATLAIQRARTDYLFDKVFGRYHEGFFDVARTGLCGEIRERLSRIAYRDAIPLRYARKGPQALRQFDAALALCRDLQAEARS